jgi:tetratricopeptide (TPR) repeat protein
MHPIGGPMKIIFAFIFIALTVSCTSIMAQEYTADYWLQKGDEFYKNNSLDLASRCYDKAIEINPLEVDAWYNKGVILKELGHITEADAAFAKAKQIIQDPKINDSVDGALSSRDITPDHIVANNFAAINESDPIYWFNKGDLLLNLGKYNESIEAYNRAIELNQSYAIAWSHKGNAFLNLSLYSESLECYNKAIELDPKYANAWGNRGNALGKQGKYDEAIKAYDEAIRLNPILANAWVGKGNVLLDQKKYDDATQAYDEAIRLNPNNIMAWNNKGISLGKQGKYDEAIKVLDKIIELDPNYAIAWYKKGNALRNLGRYNESLEAFNGAIEIDPNYVDAWNDKGNSLRQIDKYNESIEAYEKAIEIDPKYKWAWRGKGLAFVIQKKYDKAIKAYDEAIRLDPNDTMSWAGKGLAFDGLGKYDEAIKSYNKASAMDANISISMLKEGNSHYNTGEYAAAIRYYDEAIKQDPEDENAWYNKAMALRMLDRNSEAETAFTKASELGYSNPPEYVDEVSVQKAGSDGAWVYFILKDKDMAQTTSDGKVTLTIKSGVRQLYKKTYNVTKSDFQNKEIIFTTLGGSQYSENDTIYDFGRVKISEPRGDNVVVTASIKFVTPDGRRLENEGTTYW